MLDNAQKYYNLTLKNVNQETGFYGVQCFNLLLLLSMHFFSVADVLFLLQVLNKQMIDPHTEQLCTSKNKKCHNFQCVNASTSHAAQVVNFKEG